MKEEELIMLCITYMCGALIAIFIYDMMDWWDTCRNRYVYIALVFYPIVLIWLLIYYPLKYIYNKFYKIKW